MHVKDLIKKLQELDPWGTVLVRDADGDWTDITSIQMAEDYYPERGNNVYLQ